jgi:hypothetical protein
MGPGLWDRPVEPSAAEQAVIKAVRQAKLFVFLRPHRHELLTSRSDLARFQAEPPGCYRASWQLPGPDFRRQATTSLGTRRSAMAVRHGVISRSAGRTNDQG